MTTLVAGNHLHVLGAVGQRPLFDGWEDGNDRYLVGDFMGMSHYQVMFLNRSGSGGRVMIADFSSGKQPAQVKYSEQCGQSPLLDGGKTTTIGFCESSVNIHHPRRSPRPAERST